MTETRLEDEVVRCVVVVIGIIIATIGFIVVVVVVILVRMIIHDTDTPGSLSTW